MLGALPGERREQSLSQLHKDVRTRWKDEPLGVLPVVSREKSLSQWHDNGRTEWEIIKSMAQRRKDQVRVNRMEHSRNNLVNGTKTVQGL